VSVDEGGGGKKGSAVESVEGEGKGDDEDQALEGLTAEERALFEDPSRKDEAKKEASKSRMHRLSLQ